MSMSTIQHHIVDIKMFVEFASRPSCMLSLAFHNLALRLPPFSAGIHYRSQLWLTSILQTQPVSKPALARGLPAPTTTMSASPA